MTNARQMRIVTLDLDAKSHEFCDIAIPLQRLATSPDRVVAARWQMLLDLVEVLRVDGLHPTAYAQIICDELDLWPGNPANRVHVRVWVDWKDFAPLRDGLPEMHYRLQIKRPGRIATKDARSRDAEEVNRIIREAFGWSI